MCSTLQRDVRAFTNNHVTRAQAVVNVRWNCEERGRKEKKLMKISFNIAIELNGKAIACSWVRAEGPFTNDVSKIFAPPNFKAGRGIFVSTLDRLPSLPPTEITLN
jgi:hypothetical protein